MGHYVERCHKQMAPLAAVLQVVLSKAEDACASVRKKKKKNDISSDGEGLSAPFTSYSWYQFTALSVLVLAQRM